MSRIKRLNDALRSCTVEFRSLAEVAAYSKTKIDASRLDESNFVGVSNLVPNKGGKVDAQYTPNTARLTAYEPGDILIGNIRPYLQKVWLASDKGGCSGDVLAIRISQDFKDSLLPEFLYYVLSSDAFFAYEMKHAKGAKMPRGNKEATLKYRLPIPPLEIQRSIVEVLDTYREKETELEAELKAELEARKQQYEHYRREALTFPEYVSWVTLNDVALYTNGKAQEQLADLDGDVALITARFISRNGEANRYLRLNDVLTLAQVGDVTIVLSDLPNGRALARTFFVDRNDAYAVNQRVARIRVKDPKRTNPRFLHYFLNRNPELIRYNNGFDQTHLSKSQVTNIPFPILPMDDQCHIVSILEKLDALMTGLSFDLSAELTARHEQYECYRDRLLTFKESA